MTASAPAYVALIVEALDRRRPSATGMPRRPGSRAGHRVDGRGRRAAPARATATRWQSAARSPRPAASPRAGLARARARRACARPSSTRWTPCMERCRGMSALVIATDARHDIADYVDALFLVYSVIIFAYVLSSLVFSLGVRPPYSRWSDAVLGFLRDVFEPYLRIFRRFIPMFGPLDISPIVAMIVLSSSARRRRADRAAEPGAAARRGALALAGCRGRRGRARPGDEGAGRSTSTRGERRDVAARHRPRQRPQQRRRVRPARRRRRERAGRDAGARSRCCSSTSPPRRAAAAVAADRPAAGRRARQPRSTACATAP